MLLPEAPLLGVDSVGLQSVTKPLDLLALGLDDVLLVLQGLADPHLLLAQVPCKY